MKALVFHAKNPTFTPIETKVRIPIEVIERDFDLVASVSFTGADLDASHEELCEIAYMKTNHGWRGEEWCFNNTDTVTTFKPSRSTSVGDLVVLLTTDCESEMYATEPVGFQKLV